MGQILTTRQKLNHIFKDISGFDIPKEDEKAVRESKGSPIYGEINHQALSKLLTHLKAGERDILYDLGSGVGKVVIHALLASKIKKAYGVELSEARHNEALQARTRAQEFDNSIAKRCVLLNDDLLNITPSDATIIYTCSTAFSKIFMKKLVIHLSALRNPFALVTLQELPETSHFILQDKLKLDMSWTRQTAVHIYRKS